MRQRVTLRSRIDGEPQWLVVVEVIKPTSYLVRYPDGKTEILVDSE